MLLGLGIALAHAASSAIHMTSSSNTGAPCAAKMTGICSRERSGSVCVVMVSLLPRTRGCHEGRRLPWKRDAKVRVDIPRYSHRLSGCLLLE